MYEDKISEPRMNCTMILPKCADLECDSEEYVNQTDAAADRNLKNKIANFIYNCNKKYYRDHDGLITFMLKKFEGGFVSQLNTTYDHYGIG